MRLGANLTHEGIPACACHTATGSEVVGSTGAAPSAPCWDLSMAHALIVRSSQPAHWWWQVALKRHCDHVTCISWQAKAAHERIWMHCRRTMPAATP
jgi:hypothetical protein